MSVDGRMRGVMETVLERFLRYVKVDTQSLEESDSFPSTEKQKNLGRMLTKELSEIGIEDVYFDDAYGYVYARIPATKGYEGEETLGFIAHMDTSPETSGTNINPRIVEAYDGRDILLNEKENYILSTKKYPELARYVGKRLVVTDGTTLLGADDKAGIAEIMTMAEVLASGQAGAHGPVAIAFTPDEEIGCGVDHFDLKRFHASYAYTVDGGGIGELEYENFNAASAKVSINGVVVHPGEAKNKMQNASLIAMEFDARLPKEQRPEYTEGYEGFFHLTNMEGTVEKAELSYIIRDHDADKFELKKSIMKTIEVALNQMYGTGTVTVEIKDSYYNMKEMIVPGHMFLVEQAKDIMEKLGVKPIITPIRGGTDGARLSFMGLPCPNICTGGHNYHGRFEYVCVESMETIVDILTELSQTMITRDIS